MKSEWDFGTVIGLAAGIICVYVSMIWPEPEKDKLILTVGSGFRFEQVSWFFSGSICFYCIWWSAICNTCKLSSKKPS